MKNYTDRTIFSCYLSNRTQMLLQYYLNEQAFGIAICKGNIIFNYNVTIKLFCFSLIINFFNETN